MNWGFSGREALNLSVSGRYRVRVGVGFEIVLNNCVIATACRPGLFVFYAQGMVLLFALLVPVSAVSAIDTAIEDEDAYLLPQQITAMDKTQSVVSEGVDDFARWIDSFFDDERTIAEDASTRLRLSQGLILEEGEAARLKTRVNVKLNVPRFKNRLKLFVSDEDLKEDQTSAIANNANTFNENDNDTQLGLQYFAKDSERNNLSLSTGIKLDSLEVFAGPRYRHTMRLDGWQLRFTQRVRWYTSRGWESTTRLDLERLLRPKILFRNTVEGRWREQDKGYRYEINPTLIQSLHRKKALEYQWGNFFRTRPVHRFEESVLRIRYRQRIWRKWLFYEVAPQVAFRNDDDFDPTPGINFLLEVVFGGNGQYH